MPLSTFVKVQQKVDHRLQVQRVLPVGPPSAQHGLVPADGVTLVPDNLIPPHVILADKFHGKVAQLSVADGCATEDKPYYDAGPHAKFLEDGSLVQVNRVDTDVCHVNLVKELGDKVGFGKIPTRFLLSATVISPPQSPAGS